MGMPKIDELRKFVKVKSMNLRTRNMVQGEDIAKMNELIKKIPDPMLQKKVQMTLQQHPKYQALNLLLDPNSELVKHDEHLAHLLVYSGCDNDWVNEHMMLGL